MTSTGKSHTLSAFWQVFLIALFFCSSLQAQEGTGTLSGWVKDAKTKEVLPQASLLIVGTYKGTAVNFSGNYNIKGIKPGDYSVKVSFIGYGTKVYNGISIRAGDTTTLNIFLESDEEVLQTVTVVGRKNLVDLELASSKMSFSNEEISEMNVRDVQELVSMQAGVNKTSDGLQIRGARVYETEYLVDGISAQDPLAGTGFGVDVASSSIGSLDLITGGAGAEYGGGSSGVISTRIREGSDKFEISGSWQRDNLGFDDDAGYAWNTDIAELSFSGPVPRTNKKLTFFNNMTVRLSDDYFGPTADQLRSSLFTNGAETWAPRQSNAYTHTLKLAYQLKSGTKLTVTNQHSLKVNQNTRTLQIVGFDAILRPGFQYDRSLNLDNATTYTHHSNLLALNLKHLINPKVGVSVSVGRLFTNLRADANGRPFREETVDQIYDEDNIITDPIVIFNPLGNIQFVLPGSGGLYNNGGISSVWHDHYVEEYTLKTKFSYFPKARYTSFLLAGIINLQNTSG